MLLISKVDFFLSICFLKSLKLNIVGEPVDAGLLKVLNLYRYSLFVIGYSLLVIGPVRNQIEFYVSLIIEWTHKRKNSHYISMIR